ncbi:MAG: hypothetical protein ACOYCB_14040 [Fastidiosipilaceae bacterium]|jgi:hypothetical protein
MSNALIWGIIGIVVAGFIGKIVLEWFNGGKYKPIVDLVVSITVFIGVASLIVKGIKTAVSVVNSIPK